MRASGFEEQYSDLERDFDKMAQADKDVFIPMIRPAGKVDFVLIGSEPSFKRWARSPDHDKQKIAQGFRNSATSLEDFVFHHSMNEFLCAPGQSYYVTDLSKGAMTVDSAKQDPVPRYDRWWYLFRREVKLVSHERIRLFAMGSTVARYLNGKLPYEAKLPHWSGQASGHWKRIKESRSDEYARFAPTITLENIVMTARKVMIAAGMHLFVQETLDRMRTLPDSRKWLAFAYKVEIDRWWNATRRQTGD